MNTLAFAPRRRTHVHAVLFSLTVVLAGCAARTAPEPEVQVPSQLDPGAGHQLASTMHARGVQVYQCRERKDAAGQFEWVFVAPEADLYDTARRPGGRHFAGPQWEAPDGSRIVGSVRARADAPMPGAIPWLLLDTRSAGPAGRFSDVVAVQRVNTVGGLAPATPCTQGRAGQTARVPYRADYRLFTGART